MKVTICGSMQFLENMRAMQLLLEDEGHEVVIPEATPDEKMVGDLYVKPWQTDEGEIKSLPLDHDLWKLKHNSIVSYFDEISKADVILVANYFKHGIDGYVGGNVLMEIGVAMYLRKPIYFMFPPSFEKQSYGEEIMGSLPVILEGSADQFKKMHRHFLTMSAKA